MPLQIKGKVTDDYGFPLTQVAQISEIPLNIVPGTFPVLGANVWTDPDTGEFIFNALNTSSLIKISAIGYKERVFTATTVPAVIQLEPAIVLEGNTKKDNTLYWVAAVLAMLGLGYVASKQKSTKPKANPSIKKVTV